MWQGACVAGGKRGGGAHAWQGDVCMAGGHVWWGSTCMAGGACVAACPSVNRMTDRCKT